MIKGEDLKKRSSDKNPPPILRFGKSRKGIGIPLLVDAAKDPMTFFFLLASARAAYPQKYLALFPYRFV